MMDPVARGLADRWGFEPSGELPGGVCSRVYADGYRVLKVPFQGEEQVSGYLAAVRLSGNAGPRVHEFDPETGSLLMDRVVPGTTLAEAEMEDEACWSVVHGFARQIRSLDPEGLMRLDDYVDKDHPLCRRLLATSPPGVFLHGDLHHGNILRGREGWVVIDPKGLVGDPAFEAVSFLSNPEWLSEVPELKAFLRGRVQMIAGDTGYDPWRLCAWNLARAGFDGERDRVWLAMEELVAEFDGS